MNNNNNNDFDTGSTKWLFACTLKIIYKWVRRGKFGPFLPFTKFTILSSLYEDK